MNNNELKIMVPNGWGVKEKVMADGSRMLVIKQNTSISGDTTSNQKKGLFKKVPASELRLDDAFMKYNPRDKDLRYRKEMVENAIRNGLKDFWRPICDPSFDSNGKLCFEPGQMPALGECVLVWYDIAKEFAPECGSRLGTRNEYIAFMAVLIKELVESGWKVADAWKAVYMDSKKLGHYRNSKDAKNFFEPTGSREVCGWYDLSNIYKILLEINEEDKEDTWFAGGTYATWSDIDMVGDFVNARDLDDCASLFGACGWLVFDSCPEF